MSHLLRTNLVPVVKKYLRVSGIPFTSDYISTELKHSPYYPTLYSISHILSKYNVPNEAFVLEPDQLSMLEPPFITYYNDGPTGKDFIVVTQISNGQVTYYGGSNKPVTVSNEQFQQHWQKIVLAAEPGDKSIEPGYANHRRKEKRNHLQTRAMAGAAVLLLLLLLIGGFAPLSGTDLIAGSLLAFTKIAGIGVSVLLLLYDYDKNNPMINTICSAGKQTGCDAVVNGKAGKLLGMKWSEVGFFYFTAGLIFLLFPGMLFPLKAPWLAVAAILVAPFMIFSIYYQASVAKQWCPLCLVTQFILLLEAVWAVWLYTTSWYGLSLTGPLVMSILVSIAIPVLGWFAIKKTLYAAKDARLYESAYKRLLYNPEQFGQLLSQQETVADGWQELGITIGNPDASTTIIKVCNPYCAPCAKAHPVLEELLNSNNDINLKIIFTATNDEKDRAKQPVSHFLAIAEYDGQAAVEAALDEWYAAETKDYEHFAARYPRNGELARQGEKISAMKDWCTEAAITHTPTFFINGKKLPETYRVEELKNIF